MGQVGSKMRSAKGPWTNHLSHWCPACKEMHGFTIKNDKGPSWTWDGNIDAPTFSPSMLIRWGKHCDPKCEYEGGVCHYILTAGIINYCGDCTHDMKGQSVPMIPIPDHLKDFDAKD